MERAALRSPRAEARLDPHADRAASVVVECPLGRLAGEARGGVLRFLGVPYAAAPVGALRLRSPRPASPWVGTRDATRVAAASLQALGGNQTWLNEPIAHPSEDCLYLNVWTPNAHGSRPVLVWVHGGQTRNGHGGAGAIDGTALARQGLVVVTINYRLGALGGLAHPDLEDPASGQCANWGLQDKLAALAWVAQCISSFGGDPRNVTLAGQSSGAANVAMIAQHRLGDGQYARVIAQSPPLFRPPMFADLDAASEYTEALATSLGVSVTALCTIDGVALQRAEHAFSSSAAVTATMGRPRTSPVRDGRLLHAWPHDAPAAQVPVLAGWTRDEANFWFDLKDGDDRQIAPFKPPQTHVELKTRLASLVGMHYAFPDAPTTQAVAAAYAHSGDDAATWRELYTDLVFRAPILHFLGKHARAGVPAYAYEFAHPLAAPGAGSPHASDVPFVFGTCAHPHLAAKIGDRPQVAATSAAMMTAWVRFARDGIPGDANSVWPRFDPVAPAAMRFDSEGAACGPIERRAGLACWPALAA
jgi:para-nitrobenzyl esterase